MRAGYQDFIESWLRRRRDEPRALAEAALAACWSRAQRALSELSLQAIARAARDGAARRVPLLADLRVGGRGFEWGALGLATADELRTALAALLVELLTLVEATSGDILAPGLQAALLPIGTRRGGCG